jgi:hypothetical protein
MSFASNKKIEACTSFLKLYQGVCDPPSLRQLSLNDPKGATNMLNKKLLLGVSVLAFAAGTASAQTGNQSGVTQTGASNETTVCNDRTTARRSRRMALPTLPSFSSPATPTRQ